MRVDAACTNTRAGRVNDGTKARGCATRHKGPEVCIADEDQGRTERGRGRRIQIIHGPGAGHATAPLLSQASMLLDRVPPPRKPCSKPVPSLSNLSSPALQRATALCTSTTSALNGSSRAYSNSAERLFARNPPRPRLSYVLSSLTLSPSRSPPPLAHPLAPLHFHGCGPSSS